MRCMSRIEHASTAQTESGARTEPVLTGRDRGDWRPGRGGRRGRRGGGRAGRGGSGREGRKIVGHNGGMAHQLSPAVGRERIAVVLRDRQGVDTGTVQAGGITARQAGSAELAACVVIGDVGAAVPEGERWGERGADEGRGRGRGAGRFGGRGRLCEDCAGRRRRRRKDPERPRRAGRCRVPADHAARCAGVVDILAAQDWDAQGPLEGVGRSLTATAGGTVQWKEGGEECGWMSGPYRELEGKRASRGQVSMHTLFKP